MSKIRFSAVVLAAGNSSRMQGRHKMMLPFGSEPVIRHTVQQVIAAGPEETVVVTGFNGKQVIQALLDLEVGFQSNPRYQEGQMTSVAAGVAALQRPTDVVMVCLGDMVLLRTDDYLDLVSAFASMPHGSILVPHRDGQRGNPVLFSTGFVPEVIGGQRNIGCRKLIVDNPDEVYAFQATHDRYFVDMDTPEDYDAVLARIGVEA